MAEAKSRFAFLAGEAKVPAVAAKRRDIMIETVHQLYGERIGDPRPTPTRET